MVFRGEENPVSFEIVAAQPPTPEYSKEHPGFYNGWDDAYLTLKGDGPDMDCRSHPQVTQVLPLSVKLPEEKIFELKRGLEKYLAEDREENSKADQYFDDLPF